jgi:hypothetical protein
VVAFTPHPPEPKTAPATSPSRGEVRSKAARSSLLTSPLEGEVAAGSFVTAAGGG